MWHLSATAMFLDGSAPKYVIALAALTIKSKAINAALTTHHWQIASITNSSR